MLPRTCVFEDDLNDQLDDSLEELADGLDVLMILERAYDKTMRAHVKQPDSCGESAGDERAARTSSLSTADKEESASPNSASSSSSPKSTPHPPQPVPLLEGSATALLAVLDHAPVSAVPPQRTSSHPTTRSSFFFPQPRAGLNQPQPAGTNAPGARSQEEPRAGAVIRIAHLGDCMGMLIRGEEIVWRTEEMWWNVSHLLQHRALSSSHTCLLTITSNVYSLIPRSNSARRPLPDRRTRRRSLSPLRRTTSSYLRVMA